MSSLFLPELFYQITTNLTDREKILIISCSKIVYNYKSLLILDLEYNLEEINDKWHVKNIFIKDFSLENKIKELIKDLIPESIIINSKYVKFTSNNTNIKFLRNEKIIEKLVSYGYSYLAMKIMLNNDESINNINKQFINASHYGYLDIVKLLINYESSTIPANVNITRKFLGADVSYRNNQAIINASYQGHLSVVKLLIENGADIQAQNNQAIIGASYSGHLSIMELLIDSGADIHAHNDQAIISASWKGYLSAVELLIRQGADIRAQNNRVMIHALCQGHLSVVKLLVDSGIDIHTEAIYM